MKNIKRSFTFTFKIYVKMYKLLFFLFIISTLFSCKSSIKQQSDSVYSRHLQRHVPLTIITTTMPDKKEEMNLLLFNNPEFLEDIRAKKIIDSLFKKKLIKPLTLVAFEGKKGDYGLEEANIPASKQYRKFNEFVMNELYPFIKKKALVRKFNSVAICGFGKSAMCAFDIVWNNDDKIQKAGMFLPVAFIDDKTTIETITTLRKRPNIKLWITDNGNYDSSIIKLHNLIAVKNNSTEAFLINAASTSNNIPAYNFAEFLLWAFPK
jgi:hypothetical protein